MTVFGGDTEKSAEVTEEVTEEEGKKSIVESLVGDDKPFKDFEALAKGKKSADEFIEHLKSENAQLREDLDKRVSVEGMLEKLKEEKALEAKKEDTTPRLDEEVLSEMVLGIVNKKSEAERIEANILAVDKRMKEVYGEDKARDVIEKKAAEMNVGKDFLQSVAAKSPQAFYNLIGVDATKHATATATTSSLRTEAAAGGGIGEHTKEWFDNIRKTDPQRYFSPAIQNLYMKKAMEAKALGKTF